MISMLVSMKHLERNGLSGRGNDQARTSHARLDISVRGEARRAERNVLHGPEARCGTLMTGNQQYELDGSAPHRVPQ